MNNVPMNRRNNFQGMNEEQAKAEAQRRMMNNPALAQQFQRLMEQNRGKSYWDIAFSLAQQRGINLNQFMGPRR